LSVAYATPVWASSHATLTPTWGAVVTNVSLVA